MRDFGGNGQRGKNDGLGGCGYCGESYVCKGGIVAPGCVIKVMKMTALVVVVIMINMMGLMGLVVEITGVK